ncbi:MAG: hypothetical protein CMP12_02360 [Zunongwangia sp.]|nr:hypothetical protein [Zunongwangia sp.]
MASYLEQANSDSSSGSPLRLRRRSLRHEAARERYKRPRTEQRDDDAVCAHDARKRHPLGEEACHQHGRIVGHISHDVDPREYPATVARIGQRAQEAQRRTEPGALTGAPDDRAHGNGRQHRGGHPRKGDSRTQDHEDGAGPS